MVYISEVFEFYRRGLIRAAPTRVCKRLQSLRNLCDRARVCYNKG